LVPYCYLHTGNANCDIEVLHTKMVLLKEYAISWESSLQTVYQFFRDQRDDRDLIEFENYDPIVGITCNDVHYDERAGSSFDFTVHAPDSTCFYTDTAFSAGGFLNGGLWTTPGNWDKTATFTCNVATLDYQDCSDLTDDIEADIYNNYCWNYWVHATTDDEDEACRTEEKEVIYTLRLGDFEENMVEIENQLLVVQESSSANVSFFLKGDVGIELVNIEHSGMVLKNQLAPKEVRKIFLHRGRPNGCELSDYLP